jgi:hypothetical protein
VAKAKRSTTMKAHQSNLHWLSRHFLPLAVSLVSLLPLSLTAQTVAAVTGCDIANAGLGRDDSTFSVTLVPKAGQPTDPAYRQLLKVTVTLSSVTPVITYQASKEYPDLAARDSVIKLDTGDKAEVTKLVEILSAWESYQSAVAAEPSKENDHKSVFRSKAQEYDGILGESVIGATHPSSSFDAPDKLFFKEVEITFGPKDDNQRTGINVKTVPEPVALLYVLKHLPELRAKHTTAVETKSGSSGITWLFFIG